MSNFTPRQYCDPLGNRQIVGKQESLNWIVGGRILNKFVFLARGFIYWTRYTPQTKGWSPTEGCPAQCGVSFVVVETAGLQGVGKRDSHTTQIGNIKHFE